MPPDLETLRAYADGELPPPRRAEVEAAMAADPALAATVAALFASRLPYRSAFEHETLAPVPAALVARVAELSSVARASEAPACVWAPSAAAVSNGSGAPPFGKGRPKALWTMLMLLVGAALCVLLGYLSAGAIGTARQPPAEPWLRSVIAYHAMYSRETVTDGGPASGQAQTAALRKALQDQQGLALTVPDLGAQGLQFVRAQRLQFDGRTVVQLVYLPGQGAPVALCLMPAASQPERSLAIDGQHALAWHANGWAYVLIGSLPLDRLQAVRRQLPAVLI